MLGEWLTAHLWVKDFEKLVESIKMSNKRIQVLAELIKSKRISQVTFEYLRKSYESEARSLEERRRSLLERLKTYFDEIDQQIKSLEERIVSVETRYAIGEIDEESYKKQIEALQIALQGMIEELESVKGSIAILEVSRVETQIVVEEQVISGERKEELEKI